MSNVCHFVSVCDPESDMKYSSEKEVAKGDFPQAF